MRASRKNSSDPSGKWLVFLNYIIAQFFGLDAVLYFCFNHL